MEPNYTPLPISLHSFTTISDYQARTTQVQVSLSLLPSRLTLKWLIAGASLVLIATYFIARVPRLQVPKETQADTSSIKHIPRKALTYSGE